MNVTARDCIRHQPTLSQLYALAQVHRSRRKPHGTAPERLVDAGFLEHVHTHIADAAYIEPEDRAFIARRQAEGARLDELADLVHVAHALRVCTESGGNDVGVFGIARMFQGPMRPVEPLRGQVPATSIYEPDSPLPSLRTLTSFAQVCRRELAVRHPLADVVLERRIFGRREGVESIAPYWHGLGVYCLQESPHNQGGVIRYSTLSALALFSAQLCSDLGVDPWPFALAAGNVPRKQVLTAQTAHRRLVGVPLADEPQDFRVVMPHYFTCHDIQHFLSQFYGPVLQPWAHERGARFVLQVDAQALPGVDVMAGDFAAATADMAYNHPYTLFAGMAATLAGILRMCGDAVQSQALHAALGAYRQGEDARGPSPVAAAAITSLHRDFVALLMSAVLHPHAVHVLEALSSALNADWSVSPASDCARWMNVLEATWGDRSLLDIRGAVLAWCDRAYIEYAQIGTTPLLRPTAWQYAA